MRGRVGEGRGGGRRQRREERQATGMAWGRLSAAFPGPPSERQAPRTSQQLTSGPWDRRAAAPQKEGKRGGHLRGRLPQPVCDATEAQAGPEEPTEAQAGPPGCSGPHQLSPADARSLQNRVTALSLRVTGRQTGGPPPPQGRCEQLQRWHRLHRVLGQSCCWTP